MPETWKPPDYIVKDKWNPPDYIAKDSQEWKPPDYVEIPKVDTPIVEEVPEGEETPKESPLELELANSFPKKKIEENKPSTFSRAYDAIFNAPEFITKPAKEFAESMMPSDSNIWKARAKGFLGGATEGAASLLSPANILTAGRGKLPQLAAKILGGAQVLHGGSEIAEGNTYEGIGDIALGGITGASGFGGPKNVSKRGLDTITPEAISGVSSKPTAKNRLDELVAKGPDNLTPEEMREASRLDSGLKRISKLRDSTEVPISKDVSLETPKKVDSDFGKDSPVGKYIAALQKGEITKETSFDDFISQKSKPILDDEGRFLGYEPENVQERPKGPWDQNVAVEGPSTPERVIPPIRPENPAVIRMKAIEERLGKESIPEQTLPTTGFKSSDDINEVINKLENETSGMKVIEDESIPGMIDNASGESAASVEAMNRGISMKDKGEQFVVYDRAGNKRPLIGPDAVDYKAQSGETYGVEGPTGFRTLENKGGKVNISDDAINKMQEVRRGGQMDVRKPVPINPKTDEVRNPVESIERLKVSLSQSSELRPTQEHLRSVERGERAGAMESVTTPGLAGHYERLGKLKGELPSVEVSKLEQGDVDSLIDAVVNSELMPYQKLNAEVGLTKLLAGKMVTPSESKLLSKVFGDDVGELIYLHGGIGLGSPSRKIVSETVNLPRTMMSILDVSGAMRQGLPLIHKKQYWPAFYDMFKYYGSDKAFQSLQESLQKRPNFHLGEQSGLFLSDVGQNLGKREEQFLSGLVDKVPLLGQAKKGSERAYVGFLNKLRADVYDDLVDKAIMMGHQLEHIKTLKDGQVIRTPTKLAEELADFVNNASGRGDIGRFKPLASEINGLLFSPSLMASRLKLLNPKYYLDPNISPMARKESLKSLFAVAIAGGTVSGLLSQAGAEVSLNPTSSDFGKAKFGNTRLDPFGGFQQYVVAASRLISGKTTTTSGKEHDLWSSKFPNPNLISVLGDFGASKESPIASFIHTLMQGEQAFPPSGVGKEVMNKWGGGMETKKEEMNAEAINRFVPMIIGDLTEIYNEDPSILPLGLKVALGTGAALGMGLQTFEPPKPKSPFRMNMSIGQP